ncbi:hypothetical protein OPQ81_011092 [Rhizoctonia solani]|nr:hypothetical protein OPQ81_011092 [Rhizoctonia solani]
MDRSGSWHVVARGPPESCTASTTSNDTFACSPPSTALYDGEEYTEPSAELRPKSVVRPDPPSRPQIRRVRQKEVIYMLCGWAEVGQVMSGQGAPEVMDRGVGVESRTGFSTALKCGGGALATQSKSLMFASDREPYIAPRTPGEPRQRFLPWQMRE